MSIELSKDNWTEAANAPRRALPVTRGIEKLAPTWPLRLPSSSEAAGVIFVIALWLLTHRHESIVVDAQLYVGRAIASLDPDGAGADFWYRLDGQFAFSLFPRLVAVLIPSVGVFGASALLTLVSQLLWLSALAAFTTSVAKGRAAWAILICVAVSYGGYSAYDFLHYAEACATPRPFAEAFVLAALASTLRGAKLWAIVFLLPSLCFHPVMALPGVFFLYFEFCVKDRRWIFLGVAGGLCAVVAALMGAPLFSRLIEPMDAEWLAMSRTSVILFPSQWDEPFFIATALRILTIAFVASAMSGPLARLFWSMIVLCLAGIAITYLLAEVYPIVMFVQVQLWRASWVTALLATVAMCLCALRLFKEGPASRATLGLFALAWIVAPDPTGLLFAVLAIIHYRFRKQLSERSSTIVALSCGSIAALIVVVSAGSYAKTVLEMAPQARDAAYTPLYLLTGSRFLEKIVSAAALAYALSGLRLPKLTPLVVSIGLAVLGIATWDVTSAYNRVLWSNERQPELEAMVATHPGEVLWLNEFAAPWLWLGRPNWVSRTHGWSAPFSRPLAMKWKERAEALRDEGWIDPASTFALKREKGHVGPPFIQFTRERIRAICSRADAPAWILGPVQSSADFPVDVEAQFWRQPSKFVRNPDDKGPVWLEVRDIAVIDCSRYRDASS
ncbi:MAG TPA: hypothetical protein VEH76_07340 [Methylocystis sp.]|nr:hypothetical protein [Methylocystis sp.]